MSEGTFTFQGVTWGGDTRLVVESMTADMGEVRTEDSDQPYGDGVFVGRDRLGSGTWEWSLATDADDFEDEGTNALDLWEQVAAAWRVAIRDGEPGRIYPLSYVALGRRRRIYGRPRRMDIPQGPDVLAMQGQARGALQFLVTDPHTYDEEQQSHTLGRIAPATSGGILIPAMVPFVIAQTPGERPGAISVGGTAPTPFTATFHGPVVDPWLEGSGWNIRLEGTIDAGASVVVDTRTREVRRGRTNVRGALLPGSSLGGRLQPGTSEVRYGGTDPTNTSRVVLSWRPAYYSI